LSPAQAAREQERVQIIKLSQQDVETSVIAWFVNRHVSTVYRWRNHWDESRGLADRARTGRPAVIDTAARYRVVSFYCQGSPLPGCSSWNLRTAEQYLKNPEILNCSPSRSTIQRILKSHVLAPHRHKYFLQIRDPDFFPKMERLLPFLLDPPEHFFLFDECPNLQALQRKDPPMPTTRGKPCYKGNDYTRHGTTDLLAFLQMKTGQVLGRCAENHSSETLVPIFREHVELQPKEAKLFYLMDNLSPHFHDNMCHAVAELSGVDYEPRKPGAARREWLQGEDKRIVILFTPFHGSWLNPVEVWFNIFQQHAHRDRDFLSVDHLIQTIYDFIGTWNTYFFHPFNWSYNGEGLEGKALRRFVQFLFLEAETMDPKFLADELFLMHNLAEGYREQVAEEDWDLLRQCFDKQQPFISKILENESGPKRKKRLVESISLFNQIQWN